MLSGGVRYKCFSAWQQEARKQLNERDAKLRAEILKKGQFMGGMR